jgi:hypothetical protein
LQHFLFQQIDGLLSVKQRSFVLTPMIEVRALVQFEDGVERFDLRLLAKQGSRVRLTQEVMPLFH